MRVRRELKFNRECRRNAGATKPCASPTLECGSCRVYVSGRSESHNGHFHFIKGAAAFAGATLPLRSIGSIGKILRRMENENFRRCGKWINPRTARFHEDRRWRRANHCASRGRGGRDKRKRRRLVGCETGEERNRQACRDRLPRALVA